MLSFFSIGQTLPFNQAYQAHPNVPQGVLETVAWTRTHMQNIDESFAASCTGMPKPYGVMGVFDDGANYFYENGKYIAQLSNISVAEQKNNIALQIKAYAAAFEQLYLESSAPTQGEKIYEVFTQLSEIPDSGKVNLYARDAQVFEMMRYLNDADFANEHGFNKHKLRLNNVFGVENVKVLSAKQVNFTASGIETKTGLSYQPNKGMLTKSVGYGPALWVSTPSCNYSSRETSITSITIHTIQGSYAGAISWAQNCSANVSYHYVIRSSDGQITQMLEEYKKGWHVGNSNPYSIGYEHEGWISQSHWYTNAMYQSSAALTKHITTKGYDSQLIPQRTYYGASTHGTNTLGGCTRIKGHQHFPNQSHTDPGINWDWEKYYKLVNAPATATPVTAASGSIYDSGGTSGNYGNDERELWLIQPTDVTSITLSFSSFNLESGWDHLFIYDGSTTNAPLIGKYTGTTSPGSITSSGGSLLLEFRSDCATRRSGWAATYTSVPITPPDEIAPSTLVEPNTGWKTEDFEVVFTDEDNQNGSGVEKALYHVGYLSNGSWTANPKRGFIYDDFESVAINSAWTSETGYWEQNNGVLKQVADTIHNTNIYMPLNQELSNNYLYHWKGSFDGTPGNRRGGLYILCNDPTGEERGDSYFIWFRVDDSAVQFYKVENNTFGPPLIDEPQQIDAGVTYDFKLSFDRITGKMQVYIDNVLVGTYVDPDPLSTGSHVSFRSGNAIMEVDEFTVYRSRYPEADILIGDADTNDVRKQNPNPTTSSARVKSIVKDNMFNISTISAETFDVDWTAPENLQVNDGTGSDVDTIYQPTINGNWGAINDPHSGVVNYKVAVGTSAGADDVMAWTNNGLSDVLSHVLTNPIYNIVYFITVEAENDAGLTSTVSSDGQLYANGNLGATTEMLEQVSLYPNPSVSQVELKNLPSQAVVSIYDQKGQLVFEETPGIKAQTIDISSFAAGSYNVLINLENTIVVKKLIKQ
ncbi:hypothetical protein CW751_12915 [Brumimicrobium salinarum]|uniref:N-acetylmuramoyl-L-alanine amidase n=2 Tax=Brumimicrobium salinarum TaxID=2058658 RepID=A0A2I0QZS6_9FLAO|nr:hypothetical protein CW751_12915 [Brumimicrobium salinarum]